MNAHDKFIMASRMAWRAEKMVKGLSTDKTFTISFADHCNEIGKRDKKIAELEAENKRLLDQLERTQGYYAEHVAMVASKARPAYDEQQKRIAELEAELALWDGREAVMCQLNDDLIEQRDRLAEYATHKASCDLVKVVRDYGFDKSSELYSLTKCTCGFSQVHSLLDQSSSPHTEQGPSEHEDGN